MVCVTRKRRIDAGFAAKLRTLREAAGMTQGDLADAAGITRGIVARYEAGTAEPSWSAVLALAVALDVSPNDFKSGGDPKQEQR